MAKFEVFFTETVRSKVVIEANSIEEVEELFNDGDYNGHEAQELDSWEAEIEEIESID